MLLSASDLHAIAAALEPLETNIAITENPIIGRIEVIRPDSDPGSDDVVGYFEREGAADGSGQAWFGFNGVTS